MTKYQIKEGKLRKINEVRKFYDDDSLRWADQDIIKYGRKKGHKERAAFNIKGVSQVSDFIVFDLNSFDKKEVKDVKLKAGEKIYRYATNATIIGGYMPMIKINFDKGLVYFLTQESFNGTIDEIVFETRGVKMLYFRYITK